MGLRATFFVEGRTSEEIDCSCLSGHSIGFHGYDHEDLSGESTGLAFTREEKEAILSRGFQAVSDRVSRPGCFRAPYMAFDEDVLSLLPSLGVRADSSEYSTGGCAPRRLANGIMEYPVPRSRDSSGKAIAAYLWPMHEGRRRPEDYIAMADGTGDFMLATHTWHMCERRDGGVMDRDSERRNAEDVRRVLEGVLDSGFSQGTVL